MRSGRTGFCGFLALVLAATLAPAAQAYEKSDACPDVETFRPFSQWGDESDYVEIPGGSFDDETLWSASGTAGVVEADNPFQIGGTGTGAALLNGGDSITSPSICIDRRYPHLRFLARAAHGKAKLKTVVTWVDEKGNDKETLLDDHDSKQYAVMGCVADGQAEERPAAPRGDPRRTRALLPRREGGGRVAGG